MMCAGWDGNETPNPGFPKNGKWNVVWEDLVPMRKQIICLESCVLVLGLLILVFISNFFFLIFHS